MRYKLSVIIKAFVLSIVILATTVIPSSYISNVIVSEAATKKPKLNIKSKKLTIGKKCKLKIQNGGKKKWIWMSTNSSVADVSQTGEVVAKRPGSVWITAVSGNDELACEIIVPSSTKAVAKNYIKIKPVNNTSDLYEVTSTYKNPTIVTVSYRIKIDGYEEILHSSDWTLATPWDKSYLIIPQRSNETIMDIRYSYSEYTGITKKEYKDCKKAIKITDFVYEEEAPCMKVSYKNISDKTIGSHRYICFLFYDGDGNLLKVLDYGVYVGDLEAGETRQEDVYFFNDDDEIDELRQKLKTVKTIKFFVRD